MEKFRPLSSTNSKSIAIRPGNSTAKDPMPSKFSLQRPYVVATLPKPLDHDHGRYVIGEVFGGAPGLKKRKRSELVVGIDGEGLNIYDVRPDIWMLRFFKSANIS
jgi:hypothetical protein